MGDRSYLKDNSVKNKERRNGRTSKASASNRSTPKKVGRKSRSRKRDVFHSLGRKENKEYS